MTSQLFAAAMQRFEAQALAAFTGEAGKRLTGFDVYSAAVARINKAIGQGEMSRELVSYIRLAIKLNPYSPELNALMALHNRVFAAVMQARMPAVMAITGACREKRLPVPLIVSCAKYLPKARALREQFQERYFGVAPIIVRGDPALDEESYDDHVLSLPIADSYEALPVKILEAMTFFQALDDRCGVIKIDDDMVLHPLPPLDLQNVATVFASGDYFGFPVQSIFPDRIWHMGKCAATVPAVYGKPVKTAWARGALYYLSANALKKLALHYLRFPGSLDGEMYEDKAVGDILYDNQIMVVKYALEHLLGVDSTSPERLHEA